MLVGSVLLVLLTLMALWGSAISLFPIILHTRGKLFDSGEKSCEFPDILIAQGFVPRWHTGVAHAGPNCKIDVPLGFVERITQQSRRWRVHRMTNETQLVMKGAMAHRAV